MGTDDTQKDLTPEQVEQMASELAKYIDAKAIARAVITRMAESDIVVTLEGAKKLWEVATAKGIPDLAQLSDEIDDKIIDLIGENIIEEKKEPEPVPQWKFT